MSIRFRFYSILFLCSLWMTVSCSGSKNGADQGDAGADGSMDGITPVVCDDTNANNGSPELCDGQDNDCDGDIDENADMLCGGDCASAPKLNCSSDSYPPSDGSGGAGSWDTPDDNNSGGGIVIDEDGALTISQTNKQYFHVWVANSSEGTVSKLDAETGKELARYPSVIAKGITTKVTGSGVTTHSASTWNLAVDCNGFHGTTGNCPSRTAIDQEGNAYVSNRGFNTGATVTKLADWSTEEEKTNHCDERNGQAGIQTSHDANDDGTIDINDPNEFVGPEDECILWTSDAAANDSIPRALAVGKNRDGAAGWVWVGLNSQWDANKRGIVALDPYTGEKAKRANNSEIVFTNTDLAGFSPYGGVTDVQGRIWWISRVGKRGIGYVEADGSAFVFATDLPNGDVGYGITADRDGNIYVASSESGSDILVRYNPETQEFATVASGSYGTGRGIAVSRDYIWIGVSHANYGFGGGSAQRVLKFNYDLTLADQFNAVGCNQPVGVGVTANDKIWTVCYENNGRAAFADFDGITWNTQPVGTLPYTYSDFTGFNLNFIAEGGTYRFNAMGCTGGSETTQWEGFVVSEGTITAETPVTLRYRTASTEAALLDAEWSDEIDVPQVGQAIAFADPQPTGKYMQIELSLRSNNPDVLPKIKNLELIKTCIDFVP
ncbi:MAG: hypothetical protein IPJ88_10420 [Myxococcales bacterium]|nr:MAG: hypothetical protein IPJ88_10420 [Myxococcales bacterium]